MVTIFDFKSLRKVTINTSAEGGNRWQVWWVHVKSFRGKKLKKFLPFRARSEWTSFSFKKIILLHGPKRRQLQGYFRASCLPFLLYVLTFFNHLSIATKAVSSNPVPCEVYSIQRYAIKFVSDLRQVGGFLWILRFPPPIRLTAKI